MMIIRNVELPLMRVESNHELLSTNVPQTISYDEAEYKLSLSTYVWPVVEWLGRWTRDQQVASSNPGLSAIECNPGQVVNTHVPLSPSSIIWYQPMGGDALRLGR